MMLDKIRSIEISNFRSIRGNVSIPLSAPIVLIHGSNGAGKSSVLSALELALTGDIPAMRRDDPNFLMHLMNQGAVEASIGFTLASHGTTATSLGTTKIANGVLHHSRFLSAEDAKFFSERCYLAQSVLGRLLEIYQRTSGRADSPLTGFVKDLLKLDELDALVDGLSDAGHLTRAKNLAPKLRLLDDERHAAQAERAAAASEAQQLKNQITDAKARLANLLPAIDYKPDHTKFESEDVISIRNAVAVGREEARLETIFKQKRELASLVEVWFELEENGVREARGVLEARASQAFAIYEQWKNDSGKQLETVIAALRQVFPDAPSWAATDPLLAYKTAIDRTETEISRIEILLQADVINADRELRLQQEIERATANISQIDGQIGALGLASTGLARLLAQLLSNIDSENCPVCNRDYAETGEGSLREHVQRTISSLTEKSTRLTELTTARQEASDIIVKASGEMQDILSRKMIEPDKFNIRARLANLTSIRRQLVPLEKAASQGGEILRNNATAQQGLSELNSRDRKTADIRSALVRLLEEIGQPALNHQEAVATVVSTIEDILLAEESKWTRFREARERIIAICDDIITLSERAAVISAALEKSATRYNALNLAFRNAEARRAQAKTVATTAREVRSKIVSRIFNENLNNLWRDLFVRLAPTEPYVPAFSLPSTADEVVAQLETRHRSGLRGGTPGAMLSAGNLNTAALTLFLALHLSVVPKLSWLVLDDPVQSMDEVHISQFAALLRKIVRDHCRKVVIAVHERSLFDYLSLELSPAFETDQLITVELNRSISADTTINYKIWPFEQDAVIAA